MSQPPPWPAGNQSPSDQPPADQPPTDQPPAWPSGGPLSGDQPSGRQWAEGQPSAWPSAGPGQGQPPSWPAAGQSPPQSWPTPGQPSPTQSWPTPGQSPPTQSRPAPGQSPPPPGAWPPAGQPPYPGPGYAYGYGPRPPRPRRRPRFLGAIITLGVIIVLGVVIGNVSKSHETVSVSVTPFPSGVTASAGHQEPPGGIGSSFELKDGSGNVYQVTLVKVIDPAKGENQFAAPDAGKRFVGLVFRVKALTGSPKDEDANNDAVVIGSNAKNYSADFDGIAGYTNFDHGLLHLSQGETVTGSVTFQVANGVTVSMVQWTALSGFGSTVEWTVRG